MSTVIDTRTAVPLAAAAREFGVPAVTLRRWIARGDLPAHRYGDRGPWRVMEQDVADLIVHNRARRRATTRRR
jgi:excisionase family DNA binding protein